MKKSHSNFYKELDDVQPLFSRLDIFLCHGQNDSLLCHPLMSDKIHPSMKLFLASKIN